MTREAQKPDTGKDRGRENERRKPSAPAESTDSAKPETHLSAVDRQRELLAHRTRILPAGEQVMLSDDAESLTAALPPAKRDQQRNDNLINDARSRVASRWRDEYSSYHIEEGKMVLGPPRPEVINGTRYENVLTPFDFALQKYFREGHSPAETYDFLIQTGKEAKNDPNALKKFIGDLIAFLNGYYDDRRPHGAAGSNPEILARIMEGQKTVKNLICGPIAEYVVKFLNEIGVDAAVVTGNMFKREGENTEHAIVMFKAGANNYAFMGGGTDNFFVNAPNIDIALKNAFKISQNMASSGYVTVLGVANGETYLRHMFNEEAAFGHDMDRYSDELVSASSTSFLNAIQSLDARDRAAVETQITNAKNAGLSLRSITLQGAQTVDRRSSGAIKVTFEGIKGGSRRLVTFDTVVARDQQRMSALWRAVSRTFVETMSVAVERKNTGPTDSFDSSSSQGIRGRFEQAFRSGNDTHVFAGTALLNRLSGQSTTYLGQQKESDFYSMMLSQDYRYVRTVVNDGNFRLNLWVGGGYMGTLTQSRGTIRGIAGPPQGHSGVATGSGGGSAPDSSSEDGQKTETPQLPGGALAPAPKDGGSTSHTRLDPDQESDENPLFTAPLPKDGGSTSHTRLDPDQESDENPPLTAPAPPNAPDAGGATPESSTDTTGRSDQERDDYLLNWGRHDTDVTAGGLGGTFQLHETAGGMVSGRAGQLQYFTALSFSLLHDGGVTDPSTQRPTLQTGTQINSSTGFAYNIGSGAHVDGLVNFVNINTPVFDKEMAQYGIGVSVLDAAGVDGLDLRFDVGGESVREDLDISTLGSEALRRETSYSASGRINYVTGQNVYGLGVTGTRANDQIRGGVARTGQVEATYGILF